MMNDSDGSRQLLVALLASIVTFGALYAAYPAKAGVKHAPKLAKKVKSDKASLSQAPTEVSKGRLLEK